MGDERKVLYTARRLCTQGYFLVFAMLFFTTQAPVNASAPSLFKEKGNTTDVPTVPSENGVLAVPPDSDLNYSIFQSQFHLFALARAAAGEYKEASFAILDRDYQEAPDFLPTPPMTGVTFENNMSEVALRIAAQLNLSREQVNKRTFYKGVLTQAQAVQLLTEGGDPDTYLPYGITNVGGLITFYTLKKLAIAGLKTFPPSLESKDLRKLYDVSEDETIKALPYPDGYNSAWVVASKSMTKRIGHVCPYFDGMALPDKNFLPSALQRLGLYRLLASDHAGVANSIASIKRGWRSLCFTPQGMALSHIFQILVIALEGRFRPVALTSGRGEYLGSLLIGKHALLKGAQIIQPVGPKALLEETKSLDGHTKGISKLVEIFNDLADEGVEYSSGMLTSPRRINSIIRNLKINAECRLKIQEAVSLLDFHQTYWYYKDQKRLETTISLFVADGEPGPDDPMPYKSDAIFTSNKTQLLLAGYGERAPSFCLPTADRSIPLLRDERIKSSDRSVNNSLQKAGVSHLPVYILPLQQAALAWDGMKKNCVLRIKERAGKPEGAFQLYPGKLAVAQRYLSLLSKCIPKKVPTKGKGKKRAVAEDDDNEVTPEEVKRMMKRLKLQGDSANQFMSLLGMTPGASTSGATTGEDAMDDEDD